MPPKRKVGKNFIRDRKRNFADKRRMRPLPPFADCCKEKFCLRDIPQMRLQELREDYLLKTQVQKRNFVMTVLEGPHDTFCLLMARVLDVWAIAGNVRNLGSRCHVNISILGKTSCRVAFSRLFCISTCMLNTCLKAAGSGTAGVLRNVSVPRQVGSGRAISYAASECLNFLFHFFRDNAQDLPDRDGKYLTSMWSTPTLYEYYKQNTAGPYVMCSYLKTLWKKNFPRVKFTTRSKSGFTKCTECDSIEKLHLAAVTREQRGTLYSG